MFRFTIRDMLWLTVVVALAVGWGSHYNRQQAELATLTDYAYRQHWALVVGQLENTSLEESLRDAVDMLSGKTPEVPDGVECKIRWKTDWGILDEPIPCRTLRQKLNAINHP